LVILGSTFAGKKTLAKQIQQAYGGSNLKLFQMEDVIREALEYVTPKRNEEAAAHDPKAKKPVAKGKEEEKSTALFDGKDTD
jgi:adenylate kinase family enzyme